MVIRVCFFQKWGGLDHLQEINLSCNALFLSTDALHGEKTSSYMVWFAHDTKRETTITSKENSHGAVYIEEH